jgi:chemotaxis response regulator CheB
MSSISSFDSPQSAQPVRILIADQNCMASQLLAERLDRDSRFEAIGVAFAAGTADILKAVSAEKPDVLVISGDFDGAPKKGLQVARALSTKSNLKE